MGVGHIFHSSQWLYRLGLLETATFNIFWYSIQIDAGEGISEITKER